MKNVLLLTLSIAIALGICEVFLRYQPFITLNYDLVPETLDPDTRISYLTHHKPRVHPDVQRADWGSDCSKEESTLRVLFLGDSWMESMDGIPKGIADELFRRNEHLRCLRAVNGAVASYAPSLYLLKGEMLLAREDFDLIVVNIDETDLMDESLRYRKTTLRDPDGRISRVVPNVADLAFWYKRATLQHQPMYLLRLIEALYYDRVLLPRLRKEFFGRSTPVGAYAQIMSPQLSADPARTHAAQIEYFRSVLREMLARLSDHVGPSRVLLTHHPHYLHLKIAPGEKRYNRILASILREEAELSSVQYYNGLAEVDDLPAEDVSVLFMWPEDPFSHLTTEGYRRYGEHIAAEIDDASGALNRP